MPIQLNFTDPVTGINLTASYWKIKNYIINDDTSTWSVYYMCYKDQASYTGGKSAFLQQYQISGTFAQLTGITNSSTWAQIKTAVDTFAINYQDPMTGQKFFSGGTVI